jgi:small subunit ribosomal protein S20
VFKEKNMPKRRTSVKRIRVDKKRHEHNLKIKKEIKKEIKKFQAQVSAKNLNEAKVTLGKVFSLLDKAAKKRIIHPNTASRRKSRLAKRTFKAAYIQHKFL